ncbi:hypothetical protein T4D_5972 [Trichinella pseudospiralis]|uniref:Uncharacterized protein n=1 Tax=Trichinella pseudospiralis TaxID=6337 RepID=A0A0V1G3K2_TRIPS|nr:hypothetical protein T4D_5972 [Trichinella pseudospiralis]
MEANIRKATVDEVGFNRWETMREVRCGYGRRSWLCVFVRETPGRHLIFEKHLLSKRKSLLQSTMPAFAGLDQQRRDVAFPVSIR